MDMSTPLLLEVAPEIDTNPTTFYRGRRVGRRGVGPVKVQTTRQTVLNVNLKVADWPS